MKHIGIMGLIIASAVNLALPARAGEFDAWRYQSKIRFDGYTGGAALTNFPALVKLSPATIATFSYGDFASGDNADLRFTAADGTTALDYEIERWDTNGTSVVWVRVPEIADANACIYAYWGRESQAAAPCTTNGAVWGDTHLGAWHFDDDAQDATSRKNHGVNYGTTDVDGIAAGGREFGGSDYIDMPANLRNLGATNAFAIAFWFKSASALTSPQCLMEDGTAYNTDSIYLFDNASGNKILAHLRASASVQLDTIAVPSIGTDWHAMAHVYDGAIVRTYLDGVERWSATVSGGIASGNTHLQLGRRPGGSYSFSGLMDEVRIEQVSRSADWIRACWLNQGSNDVFQIYGAAELQIGEPEAVNRTPVVLDASTAVLNGYVTSTGTAMTAVSVYWGLLDGGAPTSGLWQATNTWSTGVWGVGDSPSLTVSNLTSGRFYYYRFAVENGNGAGWAPTTTNFLAGDIWVTGDTAYEAGEVPGAFTFWRAATATGEATVVRFAIASGSATPGTDYESITVNRVTIPVGETNATVTVTPIYDLFSEEDETVELDLLPGLYVVGAASNAFVTIMDAHAVASTNWSAVSASGDWQDGASWTLGRAPIFGEDVIVTNALVLGESSAFLKSFTLQNAAVTLSNWTTRIWSETVELQSGQLTLPPPFTDTQMSNRVWIVCSNLTVAVGATIDANACGYAREYGPGSMPTGSYGGSYGGRGTGENGWAQRPPVYGSLAEPDAPGSGGCSLVTIDARNNTGAGGGAIRIEATDEVALYGTLTANGGNGAITHASGGSGGAILINCRTFAGGQTGLLSAKGGTGSVRGGAGGGGRIAVVYDPAVQAGSLPVNPGVRFNAAQASAGVWSAYAEPGTLYFPDMAFLSAAMTAQWQGGDIRIPGFTSWSLASLSVAGIFDLSSVTNLAVAGDLNLLAGGRLSLFSAPTNEVLSPYGLLLTVGGALSVSNNARLVLSSHVSNGAIPWIACDRLFVAAGGVIDADSKGYGPLGASTYPGPGGGTAATYGAGASHGGQGSIGNNGNWARATQPYGDIAWPVMPGSAGGGNSVGLGGFGGGVIAISVASTAEIHGTLTADGGNSGSHGATGSGGSILIACNTFLGSPSGLIRARGGQYVQNAGGSGSGGRIAVRYDPVAQAALPQPNPGVQFSTAPGYTGTNPFLAEPGTLYLPNTDSLFLAPQMGTQWQDVNLIIPGFTHWQVAGLQIDGQFTIDGLKTLRVTGDMSVNSGGRLTLLSHPTNVVDGQIGFRLDVVGDLVIANGGQIVTVADLDTGAVPYIECGNLDVQTGGLINADYRGFDQYRGLGRGNYRGAGGYGGQGSGGTGGLPDAGQPYGTAFAPLYPGSGGGDYTQSGGRGGGAIRIGARRTMKVDGTLSANGMYRLATHAGSGSGGGILLSARFFHGGGILRANGANSSHYGGAGGGGRIAVWTPFQALEYLRELVVREKAPGGSELLDYATLYPDLTLSVDPGIGGTNPTEAEEGTIFFGRLVQGTLFILQ